MPLRVLELLNKTFRMALRTFEWKDKIHTDCQRKRTWWHGGDIHVHFRCKSQNNTHGVHGVHGVQLFVQNRCDFCSMAQSWHRLRLLLDTEGSDIWLPSIRCDTCAADQKVAVQMGGAHFETNSQFAPENGWLEYDPFLSGSSIFSGYDMLVSGRVCFSACLWHLFIQSFGSRRGIGSVGAFVWSGAGELLPCAQKWNSKYFACFMSM